MIAPNDRIFFAPATRQAELVRRREISPVELMQATLERIATVDRRLNAFVALRREDEMLADARAVEQRIARGDDPGPLAGLPLGVKDLEDAAGLPNTHGSLLFRDHVATGDTIQVERLRRAGAIVVGKTNAPEFGYTCFTTNRLFGPTRNPWNLERTPGGSSGGSSAAVAGGLVALATASDGGGSVRIPAAYTGLVGLKPTQGRIPWGPDEMLRHSACIVSGPLTRSVADAALWLDVTAGPHSLDPFSLPAPEARYQDLLERDPGRLRIGWSPTLGYARPEKQVRREVEKAVAALADAGHEVDEVDPGFPDVVLHWMQYLVFEDLAFLAPYLTDESLLDPGYLPGLGIARAATPESFGQVMRIRSELVAKLADVFARFDLLATPTCATTAFAAEGPLPIEVDGRPIETPGGGVAYTYPFNFTGNPAISLRAGFGDDGLPVGLQLVAPRLREDLLLRVAAQLERSRPWADAWPAV
ncbi:MAG TPA: amidase [Candidatus Binatia bacterium]|nr:amidase [Candidatus Binatia bacterium]